MRGYTIGLGREASSRGDGRDRAPVQGGDEQALASEQYVRRPTNVLMLSKHFRFAYRTMRCFAQSGAKVHVLGGPGSRGLSYSRFCKSYHARINRAEESLEGLVIEINNYIDSLEIDMVISADHRLTRALIKMAPSLDAPCFPMPSLEQFDILNNKWTFTQLCEDLGIACPHSRLVADAAELFRVFESGAIPIPCVVKPLDFDGSDGVVLVTSRGDLDALKKVDYYPVIVQDYIKGEDIGASVYCDSGEIKAFIAHNLKRATYHTFQSSDIYEAISRIGQRTSASGVLNFDMRLETGGKIYWLECNPRFFFKMCLSMLAGIQFAAYGLPNGARSAANSLPSGTNVRNLKASAAELIRPWRLTKRDFAYLHYVVADPVPYLREAFKLETK